MLVQKFFWGIAVLANCLAVLIVFWAILKVGSGGMLAATLFLPALAISIVPTLLAFTMDQFDRTGDTHELVRLLRKLTAQSKPKAD